ncbi:MAG: hypothetical protein ACI81A_002065, partial [Paraglaciecola sp.]
MPSEAGKTDRLKEAIGSAIPTNRNLFMNTPPGIHQRPTGDCSNSFLSNF